MARSFQITYHGGPLDGREEHRALQEPLQPAQAVLAFVGPRKRISGFYRLRSQAEYGSSCGRGLAADWEPAASEQTQLED